MSSAPKHDTETGLSSKQPSAVSLAGHVQQMFDHVRIENLVAGLSGGVVSTVVLHPLDLVKIRFAVSDGLDIRPKYRGIFHCMKSVWAQEGLRGLYQGVTPNVWGAGSSWGLYFLLPPRVLRCLLFTLFLGMYNIMIFTMVSSIFAIFLLSEAELGTYNAIKGYTKEGRQTELTATEHLVSAAEAGILTLTLTNPIWVTKTRLVLQYNADPTSKQYKGMIDALVKIYRHEGVLGLYKGYVPGLFGTSHGALQFMAYEELKRDFNRYKKVPSDAKLTALEYITMAALSKMFAVVTTYPYQVIRARLQDQHNMYNGARDVIRRTWRNEGAIGFYKGIIANMIRVTPACCITFVVYENVSRLLLRQTN